MRASDPALFIPSPEGRELPVKLEPGDQWRVLAPQDELEKFARELGWKAGLNAAVDHSMGQKPKLAKISSGLRL
jgi:hypothetical protein